MRYFIDTEFNAPGIGKPIDLISIGVVAEDGREFYACNRDFNPKHAGQWLRDNVLPHLPERYPDPIQSGGSPRLNAEALAWKSYLQIGQGLLRFIGDDAEPEFWGYFCAFDYVILSQLIGGMDVWPASWPYYMRDIRQWLDEHGYSDVSQPSDAAHDALADAMWIAGAHKAFVLGTSVTSWGGPMGRYSGTVKVAS